MDDHQKNLAESHRAAHAQQLLNDELLKEAFDALDQEFYTAWRNTGTAESETFKRERLWQAINLLGKIKWHLQYVIENGKVANKILADIEGQQ